MQNSRWQRNLIATSKIALKIYVPAIIDKLGRNTQSKSKIVNLKSNFIYLSSSKSPPPYPGIPERYLLRW